MAAEQARIAADQGDTRFRRALADYAHRLENLAVGQAALVELVHEMRTVAALGVVAAGDAVPDVIVCGRGGPAPTSRPGQAQHGLVKVGQVHETRAVGPLSAWSSTRWVPTEPRSSTPPRAPGPVRFLRAHCTPPQPLRLAELVGAATDSSKKAPVADPSPTSTLRDQLRVAIHERVRISVGPNALAPSSPFVRTYVPEILKVPLRSVPAWTVRPSTRTLIARS